MKLIKIALLAVILGISISSLRAQNNDITSVDSLKLHLKQILENSTSPSSDYWVFINLKANGSERLLLTGILTISDFGIKCTTKDGNLTLPFSDNLKVNLSAQCPSKKTVKQLAKSGSNAISVGDCYNNNMEVGFYVKFSVIETCPRVQDIAKEFCGKFNHIVDANKKNYEKFQQNYFNIKTAGGAVNKTITEEQRKLIVQANYFNDKKDYPNALEFYDQAMQLNSYSYPEAYYNMALIAAEMKTYSYAILNMRKYLLLMPEAEDARKAQDKIYEWELNMK